MTSLKFKKLNIPVTDLNGESSLPMLYDNYTGERGVENSKTDDDDELFLDYGHVKTAFPYRAQSEYTRELKPTGLDSVVLENDFLKATFVPSLGGRLWSLYDKTAQKELLFSNPVFRPAYLALRNAWFSGGVEWNFGWPGHHPLTCSPLFTAVLQLEDGTPVLRMYEYERVRGLVYQMDFFLPENADSFDFSEFDYVVDAVDTVTAKIEIVMCAQEAGVPVISSMGTGNKLDPTAFKIADIYKTSVCPLAKVMRHELRKRGIPGLKVVYSKEKPIAPKEDMANSCKTHCICPPGTARKCTQRRQVPGSNAFVPSVVGLIIAGEVIKDLVGWNS